MAPRVRAAAAGCRYPSQNNGGRGGGRGKLGRVADHSNEVSTGWPRRLHAGAWVAGYRLTSFLGLAVNAAKGSWPLAAAAAAQPSPGTLAAAFETDLPPPTGAAAATPILYAFGESALRLPGLGGGGSCREPGRGGAWSAACRRCCPPHTHPTHLHTHPQAP